MREHAAAARQVSRQPRISADGNCNTPLGPQEKSWRRASQARRIRDDDEHIEALTWGDYRPAGAKEEPYGGIIAATGRRLLLVSNGLLEQNVSQLPYEGIDGVA